MEEKKPEVVRDKRKCGDLWIDIGCGRVCPEGYIGVDLEGWVDGNGKERVDIIRDIEKNGLPFCDNSAVRIRAYAFLEHIDDLRFVMNECWRVLKPDGIFEGEVPLAGTDGAWRDPTHKRFFVEKTFAFFTGDNRADPSLPSHPKYARYGFLKWEKIEISRPEGNGRIYFKLKPVKV